VFGDEGAAWTDDAADRISSRLALWSSVRLRCAVAGELLGAFGILILGLGFLALAPVAWIFSPRLMEWVQYPPEWMRGYQRVVSAVVCALIGTRLVFVAITSAVETLQ
jgi:hypothetical protein